LENELSSDSIEELIEELSKKKITKLHSASFESTTPFIKLQFTRAFSDISYYNDVVSIGIVEKIKKIVSKKTIAIKYFGNLWLVCLMLNLIYLAIPIKLLEIRILLVLVSIIWIRWYYNLKSKNYSTIYLKDKDAKHGFLQRNTDAIIITIVSVLLAFLLPKIATFIFPS